MLLEGASDALRALAAPSRALVEYGGAGMLQESGCLWCRRPSRFRINEETLLIVCVFPLPPPFHWLIMLRVQLNLNTSEHNKQPCLINLKLLNLCK